MIARHSRSWPAVLRVLTFEHELVDLAALAELEAGGVRVRPSVSVLALAVDKLHQREALSAMEGVLVPAYAPVAGLAEIESFAAEHGWPVVLKARSGGYDGRGVWMCADGDRRRASARGSASRRPRALRRAGGRDHGRGRGAGGALSVR